MDRFMEEQEKDARAQVDALIAEYQDRLQKVELGHDRNLNDLKLELAASEVKTKQQHAAWTEKYEELRKDYQILSQIHQGIKNDRDQLQQKITDLLEPIIRDNNSGDVVPSDSNDDSIYNNDLHKTCQQKQVCLEKKVHSLEQQQQQQDKCSESSNSWIIIAQQHKNELKLLYDQYQQILEFKNHELEDYGYRVQALTLEQQKVLATCRIELGNRISYLENQVENYEVTIHNDNEKLTALQTQLDNMEQQQQKDQQTIYALTQEKTVLQDQLDKWMRYVNQQQDQAHVTLVD